MNRTGWCRALMLGLLWISPVFGQEETTESPQAVTAENAQAPDAETVQAPSSSDDSPYDYRASEEISEDLSVSFPVDI